MNENSKEPVVEQALDNIESNVSEKKMVTKSPSTSKEKISPELNTNQNNSDNVDYLSNSIFDNTKLACWYVSIVGTTTGKSS